MKRVNNNQTFSFVLIPDESRIYNQRKVTVKKNGWEHV